MAEEAKVNPSFGSGPTRGSLRLSASASSAQVSAGSDFSIFVNIQNPYDVPITIYKVDTHIPIELLDVNGRRLERVQRQKDTQSVPWRKRAIDWLGDRFPRRDSYSGVAIAVGTDFNPEQEKSFVEMATNIGELKGDHISITGLQLNFPTNPTSEELDRVFARILNYQKGLVPTTLQPGDSVVKQFVLCTRRWLFFAPLSHLFQIQVSYSVDHIDHIGTISYEQRIAAPLRSVTLGGLAGAAAGSILKSLTQPWAGPGSFILAICAAMLSSVAVTIAFARKASAQPIISIEDFWGGSLIGFSVGFFGFDQFSDLFKNKFPPGR
jgi:hypothetical protein